MSFLLEDDYPVAGRPRTAAWRQPSPQQPWPEQQPWPGQDEDPAYYDPGYAEPACDEPGYYEAAGREADQPDEYYQDPGDDFPGTQPEPDAYLDAVAGDYAETGPAEDFPDVQPPAARPRGRRYRGGRRRRGFGSGLQRMAGALVAAVSVAGVVLLAPSILTAAKNRPFPGVVSRSSLTSLNFGVAGRVGKIVVRLGQVVRKGQVLAREAAPAASARCGPTGPRSPPTRRTWPR